MLFRSIISYHIISHHITSYHIISHHITSYHIISHHITSLHSNQLYNFLLNTYSTPAIHLLCSRVLIFFFSSKLFVLQMNPIFSYPVFLPFHFFTPFLSHFLHFFFLFRTTNMANFYYRGRTAELSPGGK